MPKNYELSDLLSMNPASRDSALKQLAQSGSEGAKILWLRQPNITLDMPEEKSVSGKPWFRGEVQKLLTARLWDFYHPEISHMSNKGYPDLTAWRERVIWLELKSEKGQLSQDQANTIEMLKRAGGEVYVFRPSDWKEIIEILW